MASLEDKILGNKEHNYCSSSEDEGDDGGESDCEDTMRENVKQEAAVQEPVAINDWDGTSSNTGPKGVIKDWQRYKQLEVEARERGDREREELIKKLSLTCMSHTEEQEYKKKKEMDDELDELLNDDFLLQYQKQRMQEMLTQLGRLPRFGTVIPIHSTTDFLECIDSENKSVTIIVHVYEDRNSACDVMNGCLISLSQEYPTVKFCKLLSSTAGMSRQFKINGVPALLVYKAGQLIANFVRISQDLGEDFFATDVENFLLEHGLLPDKSCIPQIMQSSSNVGSNPCNNDDDDDSDISLD